VEFDRLFRREHKAAVNLLPLSADLLIDHWLAQAHRLSGSSHQDVAFASKFQLLRVSQAYADLPRVRSGRHHKVVFELLPVAVINEVNSRIHALVIDFCIIGDAGSPL